ncbi:30S ribosomal protein S16 [Jejudonia soesokkakensis]|uniref:Small ribosomal subunit protein bS16 n=1 Tax=Jejudonia soesokkakensis TaxID=1323432 RepID=A0ABW2MNI2_9FLAO
MPVKIRLQRHGKKGKPFYWIVAADARAKRDGKYLEKLGVYNPNVNPAHIELDMDSSVKWLQNGAQPTDTARAILSYKGVMMKNHLAGGVRKGALTEEQAENKFNAWLEEKAKAVEAKKGKLSDAEEKAKAEALAAEKATNEARIAANAPVVEEAAPEAAETTEEAVAEDTSIDAVAAEAAAEDAPAKEEAPAEPAAEAKKEEE